MIKNYLGELNIKESTVAITSKTLSGNSNKIYNDVN